jgi:hypothetical protein
MHDRPPQPSRSPADQLFNSVQLSRRNSDGNEEMHRQIDDEALRIAANIAKLPATRARLVSFVYLPLRSAATVC